MHRKSASLVAFAALSVLCGVGAHLVAELASLGAAADARLIFSARHVPLGLLTLAALVTLVRGGPATARPTACLCGERVCRCASRLLPLAFVAQSVVCVTTQLGEGTPIETGDLTVGILAALLAGALGALVIVFAQPRIVGALAELFVRLVAQALPRDAKLLGNTSARSCASVAVVRLLSRPRAGRRPWFLLTSSFINTFVQESHRGTTSFPERALCAFILAIVFARFRRSQVSRLVARSLPEPSRPQASPLPASPISPPRETTPHHTADSDRRARSLFVRRSERRRVHGFGELTRGQSDAKRRPRQLGRERRTRPCARRSSRSHRRLAGAGDDAWLGHRSNDQRDAARALACQRQPARTC